MLVPLLKYLICSLISIRTTVTTAKAEVQKLQKTAGPCDQEVYRATVAEDTLPGAFVLRVSAKSIPLKSTNWSIPDIMIKEFTINTHTGDITVLDLFRRTRSAKPTGSFIEFDVLGSGGQNEQSCRSVVRINVIPIGSAPVNFSDPEGVAIDARQLPGSAGYYGYNNLPPNQVIGPVPSISFNQGSYQFTVQSCTPGSFIGQLFVQSVIPTLVTFSISSGNVFYSVNPQTGVITVRNIPPIGYQTILITAQLITGQTITVPVTINSPCTGGSGSLPNNLYSPAFFGDTVAFAQPSYQFNSAACGAGVVVGQVLAQANGQSVTYSIPGTSSYFSINPISGILSTSLAPPGGTWSQTFTVAATSGASRTTSVSVTVINACANSGGLFRQSVYSFILKICAVGQIVGNVGQGGSAPPGGAAYSIPSGSPYFAVTPSNGQISVLQPPPLGIQSLKVQAMSSNGQISTANVAINVVPGPPAFSRLFYSFTISNCVNGAIVGQISAASCGVEVSYSMLGHGAAYFIVNQLTGLLSVWKVPPSDRYILQIQAISSNGQRNFVSVIITSLCGRYSFFPPYSYRG